MIVHFPVFFLEKEKQRMNTLISCFIIKISINLLLFFLSRDEDMQSMASLMSVNNNSDIAPLDDFDNEDIPEDVEEVSIRNLDEILDISAQLDFMTSSLTENELPGTPISGN